MWWSRRGVLALGLALPGCGFRPLYGENAPARDLVGRLAVGEIVRGPLPDRMGFSLRDAIAREIGPAREPRWLVDIAVAVEELGFAITPDNATTRYSLTGTARWTLRRPGGTDPLLEGRARSFTAYSATASVYATRIAARDAERRLAEGLARQIVAQISARAGELPA